MYSLCLMVEVLTIYLFIGLRRDAQAALDYLKVDPELSNIPIVCCDVIFPMLRDCLHLLLKVLYGTSLGGAVAIDLASRNTSSVIVFLTLSSQSSHSYRSVRQVAAVVVENTFQSLPLVVRDWPVIGPFSFLCMQKWNSASKIHLIPPTTAILMLSGSSDEVVPQKHMKALWGLATQRGKKNMKRKQKDTEPDDPPKKDVFEAFPQGFHGLSIRCLGGIRQLIENQQIPMCNRDTGRRLQLFCLGH